MTTHENLKYKAQEVAENVGKKGKEGLEKAKDQAEDMSENIADKSKEHMENLKENVSHYVKDNPIAALGLAALAGMAISLLLRR